LYMRSRSHSHNCLNPCCHTYFFFFFFNDTATTEIYTLSLHDAFPISTGISNSRLRAPLLGALGGPGAPAGDMTGRAGRRDRATARNAVCVTPIGVGGTWARIAGHTAELSPTRDGDISR